MKKLLVFAVLMFVVALGASAEEQQKFSPEKFQADLEQYITTEAGLTNEEAAKFFPLYREMQQKQRVVYNKMHELFKLPHDEASCKRAVQRRDQLEIELKQIAQTYHNKFLRVLPASKVIGTIIAEDKFHRRAFRKLGQQRNAPKK
ncbi:hypothetical protein PRMUPPPA20_19470 [Xylanibacter ruminicola]|jgi:hypothetical protein|uniref:Periplasmic heavy metal sensor n=2 Tax=Xylanibacter ruminicola TaxID=839 RepID=D5ESW3_XYLR2|nr:hypothetical protein [Xylanibacter ruminicola]ADE82418.1 conserved hypothetical protein [Xylanibacter ruminicola 23]GJG33838.1 hypothetical protein PRMUPPPA20_19470 [Xylanibacter ruminicola]SEH67138.1 hypothetical protein SAMN02745192_0782 [Xylanibacter ruminicola]